MKYTWLLFDADDTLFDYDKAEVAALQGTFDLLGLPYEEPYARVYRQINGDIWLDFEKKIINPKLAELLKDGNGKRLNSLALSNGEVKRRNR